MTVSPGYLVYSVDRPGIVNGFMHKKLHMQELIFIGLPSKYPSTGVVISRGVPVPCFTVTFEVRVSAPSPETMLEAERSRCGQLPAALADTKMIS